MEEEKEKQWVLVHTSSTMRSQELADEEARLRLSGFDVTILRDWQSDWAATVDCDKHFLVSKISNNYTKTDRFHIQDLVRDARAKKDIPSDSPFLLRSQICVLCLHKWHLYTSQRSLPPLPSPHAMLMWYHIKPRFIFCKQKLWHLYWDLYDKHKNIGSMILII